MDSRYRSELLKNRSLQELEEYFIRTQDEITTVRDNIDLVDSKNVGMILAAVSDSSHALSELSISTSKLIGKLLNSSKAEAIGEVIADVIRAIGTISTTLHSAFSMYSNGPRGQHTATSKRSLQHGPNSHTARHGYEDALVALGANLSVWEGNLRFDPVCLAIKHSQGYELNQQYNKDLKDIITTGGGPGILIDTVKKYTSDDSKWISASSANIESTSVIGYTVEKYIIPNPVTATIRYAKLAAPFTNFTDLAQITGATSVHIAGLLPCYIDINGAPTPTPATLTHRTIDRHVTAYDHVFNIVRDIHEGLANLATVAALTAVAPEEALAVGILEGLITLDATVAEVVKDIIMMHTLSHWQTDMPDAATEEIETEVAHTITFCGAKLRDGSQDTYYTGRDTFSGWDTYGVTAQRSEPTFIGKGYDDIYNSNPSIWDDIRDTAADMLTFGSNENEYYMRSKIQVGTKALDASAIPSVTGNLEYKTPVRLSTTIPVYDPITNDFTTNNGIFNTVVFNPATEDILVYLRVNGEDFIIAHRPAGGSWTGNPGPVIAAS